MGCLKKKQLLFEHLVLKICFKSCWFLDATIKIKQDRIARNLISCETTIFRYRNLDNIEAPIWFSGFLSSVLYRSGLSALISVSHQRIKLYSPAGFEPWSSGSWVLHFDTELCCQVIKTCFVANTLMCHCYPAYYISS